MTIRAILTDIEGTTSSLSFVKDVLFPYARAHLAAFVSEHGEQPQVQTQLAAVSAEAGQALSREQAVDTLIRWIDEDRKITPLKALQGLIWEAGYRRGDFQGHVYDDAAQALRQWHADGIRLYVYSSGSVQAQQLLFAHTAFGDLTPLFSGYFDTRIGAKTEQASYEKIAGQMDIPPSQILFLSDVTAELDAAAGAGMKVLQLVRDEDVRTGSWPGVRDFTAIDLSKVL